MTMINIDKRLEEYIENVILPFYEEKVKCHATKHVRYVIRRSLEFAKQVKDQSINFDMVYATAAFHDIGNSKDRTSHHIIGAEMFLADKVIPQFFSPEQMQIISQAIQDHRASTKHEPRNIYGKIVSSADRMTSVDEHMITTYKHHEKYNPNYESDRETMIAECLQFTIDKYCDNGYAVTKIYFKDPENEKFLKELGELCKNKTRFKQRFLKANGLI